MTATVLVGGERRRRWTRSQKLGMVEESLAPGANIADVARRHDVHPNQLYGWRRAAACGRLSITAGPQFSPVEITDGDQAALVSTAGIEAEAVVMIEVVLRNGRLLRFPERIDARRAGWLADVLEGDER
jgi:transposase